MRPRGKKRRCERSFSERRAIARSGPWRVLSTAGEGGQPAARRRGAEQVKPAKPALPPPASYLLGIGLMKTGYLIDMDGVIYRESQLIPGVVEFVDALNATGTPFLFLTNNSAPTAEDLAVRLGHLGIPGISPRHFYTSALNTADFLSETHPGCTVLALGEGGLMTALHERKIANDAIDPSYVVVGEGA